MSNISVKKLHTFLGHNDSIYALEALDEHRFVSAGGDKMIVLWNLKVPDKGEVIVKMPSSIYALAFDKKEEILYVGQNNEGIYKIDLSLKKEVISLKLGSYQVFDLRIIDGKIWAGLSSGEVVVLSKDLTVLDRRKYTLGRVRSIDTFDKSIAVGFSDTTIGIINSTTLEIINELRGHKNSVFSVKFHPSGKYLISAGRDAHIKVWDTNENYILRESIAGHLYTINHVAFREDGRYFMTASMDKSVKFWDAHNFRLLKILDKHRCAGHNSSVNKLLWMNYQDLLVTCSDDRSISVWEFKIEE